MAAAGALESSSAAVGPCCAKTLQVSMSISTSAALRQDRFDAWSVHARVIAKPAWAAPALAMASASGAFRAVAVARASRRSRPSAVKLSVPKSRVSVSLLRCSNGRRSTSPSGGASPSHCFTNGSLASNGASSSCPKAFASSAIFSAASRRSFRCHATQTSLSRLCNPVPTS